jgi:hypothetical protein
MIDTEKTTDIVDTTDCLEAVGAFKAMKNFLFTVSIICLFLLQLCFILDRLGYIDKTKCLCRRTSVSCAGSACTLNPEPIFLEQELQNPPLPPAENSPDQPQTANVEKITADAEAATENAAEQAQDNQQPPEPSESDDKKISEMLMPRARYIAALIKTCNFILIITITLYSLMLLMILKISLTGRLGGINHISRAFFISLFALVLLLPWQLCFPSVIAGVIYTPKELLCSCNASAVPSAVGTIFCYLRFTGLWLIEILLLVFAQLRSMRWSKATLRRLGIIQ